MTTYAFPSSQDVKEYKTTLTRLDTRPTVAFSGLIKQLKQCDDAISWVVTNIETQATDALLAGHYKGPEGASAAARYHQLTLTFPELRTLGELRAEKAPARAAELRRARAEQEVMTRLAMQVVHMMGNRFALKL